MGESGYKASVIDDLVLERHGDCLKTVNIKTFQDEKRVVAYVWLEMLSLHFYSFLP